MDGDTITPQEVPPGAPPHWEQMNNTFFTAPKAGSYPIRACADDGDVIPETNEEDNCIYNTLIVKKRPASVHIYEPHAGVQWKSSKDHWIKWHYYNLPHGTPIIVQYYNMGQWRTIHDGYTTNDGKKKWRMKKNRTKDDHNGKIRIIRQSDGKVLGHSADFFIDRKKGTPKL